MRKVFLFFFLSALCACETMNIAPIPTTHNPAEKQESKESEQSRLFRVCQLKNDIVSLLLTGNGNGTRSWVVTSYNFVNPDGSITPIPGLNEPCILDNPIFFNPDGTLLEPQGSPCSPTDPDPADQGTWEVSSCGKVISLDTFTFPNTNFTIVAVGLTTLVVDAQVNLFGAPVASHIRVYLSILSK